MVQITVILNSFMQKIKNIGHNLHDSSFHRAMGFKNIAGNLFSYFRGYCFLFHSRRDWLDTLLCFIQIVPCLFGALILILHECR